MPDHPRWNAQSTPEARATLLRVSREISKALMAADGAVQLAFLTDTRAMHGQLFRPLTPPGFEYYAGNYRGSNHPALLRRNVAVRHVGHPMLHRLANVADAADVSAGMERLTAYIHVTVSAATEPELYYRRCCRIFHDFAAIHPYLDGNGHVSRLLMLALMTRRGIAVRHTWTVFPRPHTAALAMCLQSYHRHPDLLVAYLRTWFGPDQKVA